MLLVNNKLGLQGKLFEIANYFNNLDEEITSIDFENGYSLKNSFQYNFVYVIKNKFMIFYHTDTGEYDFYKIGFVYICSYELEDDLYRYISHNHDDEIVIPELINELYKTIKEH